LKRLKQNIPANIRKGKIGEKAVRKAVEMAIDNLNDFNGTPNYITIECVAKQKQYTWNTDLDVTIYKNKKLIVAIEVKNWNEYDRPLEYAETKKTILDYFDKLPKNVKKVLVITWLKDITKKCYDELINRKITVINTEAWLSQSTTRVVRNLEPILRPYITKQTTI